ncbi:MAG: GNAT family N-acetyltransferase [Nocardioides sp.]|uniref:GNAT family N-acetyltransferase n=1 Tax=Nocardioides sp. TaxID=35761 RepID=UPI0039E6539C
MNPANPVDLDASAVVAASNDWVWYPDDAQVIDTADYLLVDWPAYLAKPPEVLRVRSARASAELLDEIAAQARAWGATRVTVWVRLDAPANLAQELLRRGAEVGEDLDVLALDLSAAAPALPVPEAVRLRWQRDLDTARDAHRVALAAFEEGTMPDPGRLRVLAEAARVDLAAGRGGTVIAYLDGEPVASAGLTMASGVARLWGGGVIPSARGRGAYRATLAARLGYARRYGATMALVKGRVLTSGPILRRAGFAVFGKELCYRLPV